MKPLPTAALYAVASAVTFAASSAAAKFLGQKLPTAELAFFRSIFGVPLRANDGETSAPRKFKLEGEGNSFRGHAQQDAPASG